MQLGTIDLNKLRGIGDKGLGLLKELIGALINNEGLEREGKAQQERASAELDALREELKAESKEAKAEALETRQKAAERAKEAASN